MEDDDLNPFFACVGRRGQEHLVYMLDAVTMYNELSALRGYEARGAALWYLGSEDPTIWSFFDERKLNSPYQPDLLKTVDLPGLVGVDADVEGNELMTVTALARGGQRDLAVDADGLITDERYRSYPNSLLIGQFDAPARGEGGRAHLRRRTRPGLHPADSGYPEGQGRARLPSSSSVNSPRAIPRIVARCWREGNEIGNHTYTHPHMGTGVAPSARSSRSTRRSGRSRASPATAVCSSDPPLANPPISAPPPPPTPPSSRNSSARNS